MNNRWKQSLTYEKGDIVHVDKSIKISDGNLQSKHYGVIVIFEKFISYIRMITSSNIGTNKPFNKSKQIGNKHIIKKNSYITDDLFVAVNVDIKPTFSKYNEDEKS